MSMAANARICIGIALLVLLLSACATASGLPGLPEPLPHEVDSPEQLPVDLVGAKILWPTPAGGARSFTALNAEGEAPIPLPSGAASVDLSPSGTIYVISTDLFPGGDIELIDVQTGNRRGLVVGKEIFPGAALRFPMFTAGERSVVFEVASGDRIDLAFADLATGEVQFLDLGGFNQWPRVSPDGRFVLVACERESKAGLTLCLIDRERRVRTRIVEETVYSNGMFTPDGKETVYIAVEGGVLGEGFLHRAGLDGSGEELLSSGLHSGAAILAVTPKNVVFTCRYPAEPACSWVCTIGLDSSNPKRLTYLGDQCVDGENGSESSQYP